MEQVLSGNKEYSTVNL